MEPHWARNTWNIKYALDFIVNPGEQITLESKPNIGETRFRTKVPKDLLCFYSPYYTAALKGEFAESKKDVLLVDLASDTLRRFVGWLYSGSFVCETGTLVHKSATTNELMELYIFADMTDILALRRSIMTIMCQRRLALSDHQQVASLLSRIAPSSGLFRFLVDKYVDEGHITTQAEDKDLRTHHSESELPSEFLIQVIEALERYKKRYRDTVDYLDTLCNYHEHENREEWAGACNQVPGSNYVPYEDYYTHKR